MKTPSFGNNSGPDDHYTVFKSNERREKEIDKADVEAMRIFDKSQGEAQEIEFVHTFNKKRTSDAQ